MKWMETGEPDYEITDIRRFERIRRPCIYGWVRGDKWLYFGCSTIGTRRIRREDYSLFRPGDKIKFYFFPAGTSGEELRRWEARFIADLEPTYNKNGRRSKPVLGPLITCKFCRKSFSPVRSWQFFCCLRCRNAYHNNKRSKVNMWNSDNNLIKL